MATVKELYDKGAYIEAAVLGKNSSDPEEIFIGVSSYLSLGQGEEGMSVLLEKRGILWKANPLLTLKANFDLRFILGQFDEAYEDLAYFSDLPYVSQKVEEALRALPKTIRANELASKGEKDLKEEEIIDLLEDLNDPMGVLVGLNELKNKDIARYLEQIKAILVASIHPDVKTFALMLLVEKSINEEIPFEKANERLVINPSKLGSPFDTKAYRLTRAKIAESNDSSLSGVALGLLDQYCLALYPRKAIEDGEEERYASALLALGARYLGSKNGEEDLLVGLIEKTLNENPPLG